MTRPPRTVAGAIDRFVAEALAGRRPHTVRQYRHACATLRAGLGLHRLAALRPAALAAWLDKHPSRTGANRARAVLSAVYRHAIRAGWVDRNPVREVAPHREIPRSRYVEDGEFDAVKAHAPPWMQDAMDFAYITGLRQGDMLALRWNAVQGKHLVVTDEKTGARGRYRIKGTLAAVLRRLRARRGVVCSVWLFSSPKSGSRYTCDGFRCLWRRVVQRALDAGDLSHPFTWHDIRAKHATDGHAQGLDVQRTLGHASPATTGRYLRSRARDERDVLEVRPRAAKRRMTR